MLGPRVPDLIGVGWERAVSFLTSLQVMLILMVQGAHCENDFLMLPFSKSDPQILKSESPGLPSNLHILRTYADDLNPNLQGVMSVICILSSSPGSPNAHSHLRTS